MAKTKRIYEVPAEPLTAPFERKMGPERQYGKKFLVQASSQTQAEKHVAAKYIGSATLVSTKQLRDLMVKGGATVEDAKEDE